MRSLPTRFDSSLLEPRALKPFGSSMNTGAILLRCTAWFCCVAWFCCAGWIGGTRAAVADDSSQPDFNRQLAPILSQNCIACHNAKTAEGGLNLESHASLMQGGDSGVAIEPSRPQDSQLLLRMASDDDPMPPLDNAVGARRLTADEIELFRKWISAGGPAPELENKMQFQWQAIPDGLQPIYAIATSPDGNYLSYGRGSLVTVTSQNVLSPDSRQQTLIDPSLSLPEQGSADESAPTTHLDIVQSLAFSPDSQRLATGGFRNVKLWRRVTEPTQRLDGLTQADGVHAISPNGRWIAHSSGEHMLEITDYEKRQSHRFLDTHTAPIVSLAWLGTSPLLLSCDSQGKMWLTAAHTNDAQPVTSATPFIAQTMRAIDESRLMAIDDQGQLHELSISTEDGNSAHRCSARAVPGWDSVVDLALASVEPAQAVMATKDGKLRLVALADMQTLREIDTQQPVRSVSISPDAQRIAALPPTGPALVWNAADGGLAATLELDYLKSQLLQVSQRNVARQEALVAHWNKRLPELQKAVEQEEQASQKVQQDRDKAAEALATKDKEIVAAATRVTEAEQELVDTQKAIAEMMKLLETKTSELENHKKAAAELEKQKLAAEEELAKREQALATAKDSTARAAARLPELQEKISGEQAELEKLKTTYSGVQAQAAATDQPQAIAFTGDSGRIVVAHSDLRLRVFSAIDGATRIHTGHGGSGASHPRHPRQSTRMPAAQWNAPDLGPKLSLGSGTQPGIGFGKPLQRSHYLVGLQPRWPVAGDWQRPAQSQW